MLMKLLTNIYVNEIINITGLDGGLASMTDGHESEQALGVGNGQGSLV